MMQIDRPRRLGVLFTALLLASCGGTAEGEEETTGGEEVASTGGETEGGETTSETDAPADPCPPGETAPCESATEVGPTEVGETPDGGVPSDAGTTEDPAEAWRIRVRRGRAAFDRFCDTCHPGGEEDIGPTLRRIHFPVARMQRQIRQGSGRMRPIPAGRLGDDRMDDLMAYLSTIGAVRGVERPE